MQVINCNAIPTEPLQSGTMYRINKRPIQFSTTMVLAVALLQIVAIATAQPTLSVAPGTLKQTEIAPPVAVAPVEAPQQTAAATNPGSLQQVAVAKEVGAALQGDNDPSQVPSRKHTNTAEKLKRGLSNFLNQSANPASFFVPAPANQLKNLPHNSAATLPAANNNQARTAETYVNNKARSFVSSVPPRWGRR